MPDYRVVSPVEYGENNEKTWWQEIGSGWCGKDDSIQITLNALPINRRIVLFVADEQDAKEEKATKKKSRYGNK